MKDGNAKKILPIVIVLIVVALLVLLGVKLIAKKGEKEVTGEKKETVEKLVNNYFTNITTGMGTAFGGTDVLFSKTDKQTVKDFNDVYILNIAFSYVVNEGKGFVGEDINAYIKRQYEYTDFTALQGKEVRSAIKKLFGVDFKDTSAELFNFDYNFVYDENNDIYIRRFVGTANERTTDYLVYAKALKTVEKGDNLEVEVVVAYVYGANKYYSFTKDSNFKNVVFDSDKYEMKDDKVNEFDHYIVTLKKDGDNYVFESIQKK